MKNFDVLAGLFNGKKLKITGSGITLTNNEIKYIIKVIRCLENRGILLKGTTKKVTSQEEGFLNFLRPLMSFDFPLIKNVLIPLAKSVLVPLSVVSNRCSYLKENVWIRYDNINNFKQRNGIYHGSS